MSNKLKKIEEKIKYSHLTVEELKKLEDKGLQLTEELRHIDFINNPYEFKEKSLELNRILTVLNKYKRYAKD